MFQFFGYAEEDKGYYVGIVASCIFLGRVFSRLVNFMVSFNHTQEFFYFKLFYKIKNLNLFKI